MKSLNSAAESLRDAELARVDREVALDAGVCRAVARRQPDGKSSTARELQSQLSSQHE